MSPASTLLQISHPPVPQTPRMKSGRTNGLEAEMDSVGHLQESRFPEDCGSPLGTEDCGKTREEAAGASTTQPLPGLPKSCYSVMSDPGGQICHLSPVVHSYGISQALVFSSGKCVC